MRLVFRLENLGLAVFRKRFRSFVHRPAELERAVAERGFARSRVARGLVWETAQFVPNDAVAGAAPACPDEILTKPSGSPDPARLGSETCVLIAIIGLLTAIAILVF